VKVRHDPQLNREAVPILLMGTRPWCAAKQALDQHRLTPRSITPFFAGERPTLGQIGVLET
jgi:hypothetical protein